MLFNDTRAKDLMDRDGVDCLLATTSANVFYLSGVNSLVQAMFPWDSQVYAMVTREKLLDPYVIVPLVDADTAIEGFKNVNIIPYGTFYRYVNKVSALTPNEIRLRDFSLNQSLSVDAFSALKQSIKQLKLEKKVVAFDERGMDRRFIDLLSAEFPLMNLLPASNLFKEIRMVKTSEEINRIAMAAQITEKAILDALESVHNGISEIDLALSFEKSLLEQEARVNFTCLHFGKNIAFLETAPNNSKLVPGDLIWFDVGCYYKGYASDTSRVFSYGNPNEYSKQLYDSLYQGWSNGIKEVRAGVSCKQIFQSSVKAVNLSGLPFYKRSHVGHGIGLETYDQPSLSPTEEICLINNMVINLELPYYEIGFGGFNIEDTLVVNYDMPLFLTKLDRNLVVI